MPTTYIVDKDGNQIEASKATVPSDRHFRGAWSLSGNVISEDLAKAKEIFRSERMLGYVEEDDIEAGVDEMWSEFWSKYQ